MIICWRSVGSLCLYEANIFVRVQTNIFESFEHIETKFKGHFSIKIRKNMHFYEFLKILKQGGHHLDEIKFPVFPVVFQNFPGFQNIVEQLFATI